MHWVPPIEKPPAVATHALVARQKHDTGERDAPSALVQTPHRCLAFALFAAPINRTCTPAAWIAMQRG